MSEAPIFLLSSERSGSNLMRVMMNAHPRLSAPDSAQVIKTMLPVLSLYGRGGGNSAELMAADMCRILETQLGAWEDAPLVEDILEEAGEEAGIAEVLTALFTLQAKKEGKVRSFIKDNGGIPHAFALASLFPESPFVYLVRDARDMALSWKRSPGHPGGVKDAAMMWRNEQEAALRFLAAMEVTGRVMLVRYEDLIRDGEQELRKLCAFLGEEFDEEMLEFHNKKDTQRAANTMSGWANLKEPLMQGNSGKWQGALSEGEVRCIESVAGVPMVQLGYLEGGRVSRKGLIPDDLVGKLWRGGRTFLQHLLRGRKGLDEFERRIRRLRTLQGIETERRKGAQAWVEGGQPDGDDGDDRRD